MSIAESNELPSSTTREHPMKHPGTAEPNTPPQPIAVVAQNHKRHSGDEVPEGTPGSADNTCPRCHGSGKLGDVLCSDCDGSGVIHVNVGDA